MKKHISFPSIEQFRSVVASVNRQFNFVGIDDKGEAIYDITLPKPILTFKGTVKLHGTNASVCFNNAGGMWFQSKENIITPTDDNNGFAFFAEANKLSFMVLMHQIKDATGIDLNTNTISIFGEWCGGSIQKGVGICNLEKSFFIIGVKISPIIDIADVEALKKNPAYWVDSAYLKVLEKRIFNIYDYQTYEISIDFNMPGLVRDKLSELTVTVEAECPVAKAFGLSGIGEGIVWSCEFKGSVHRFKVKGEKHSSSRVKTLAPVDTEKLNSIVEFVDYAVTESRFNQAMENTFVNGEPIDVKKLGDLLRWIIKDILKEELDTMAANNIEPKEVNKYISAKARKMFFELPV